MRLEPLQLWLRPAQGPMLSQLRPALAAAAEEQAGPGAQLLRWAITAAEPERGLRIEAVLLVGTPVAEPGGTRLAQPAPRSRSSGPNVRDGEGVQETGDPVAGGFSFQPALADSRSAPPPTMGTAES